MAFPPGFLDEIRIRVSLPEVIGRKVRLIKKGREYSGLCPFHNEKSPSFTVNDEKGFFHCFGCGAHGDVIGYVMQSQNLGFLEAVEQLAGEAGLEVPRATPQERERVFKQKTLVEVMEAAAGFFQAQLESQAGAAARAYLDQRGLDRAAIERFRLGYAPGFSGGQGLLKQFLLREFPEEMLIEAGLVKKPDDGRDSFDYFRDRVMFPILDRAGRVIAFGGRVMGDGKPKYLNSPDTPLFHKGRVLYGLSWARAGVAKGASLVVTEGYMDVIALHRAGFEGAVAPLGTALTEEQLEELWKLTAEPTLCFDGDLAGQRAASRALDRALPLIRAGRSLKFAVLSGGHDPDTLIARQGTAAMQAVLDGAKPLAEVLFAQELAAKPIDTPERRADLTKRLRDRAASVRDEDLAREYQFFFRNRVFENSRVQRKNISRNSVPKGGWRTDNVVQLHDYPGNLFTATRELAYRQAEILLVATLTHPWILEGAVEEFAALELPDVELAAIQTALIDAFIDFRNEAADHWIKRLYDKGYGRVVDRLLHKRVLFHAAFLRGDDREQVVDGWYHTLEMWWGRREGASKLAAALKIFNEFSTQENWERVLACRAEIEAAYDRQAELGAF